jgi:hypothetical protein
MMFQLVQDTTVTLSHINVRTEKHGPADVDAFDLDFALTGENRKLLALLHPRLCESLFFNAEREAGQEVAEGVDDSVPNLRFTRLADALPWSDEATGVDLTVVYGLGDDASNIRLEGGKATMKKIEVTEGGSVTLVFKYSISGYPDGVLDKLRKKLKQEITITMVRPEKLREDAVIDGTTAAFKKDHPDAPGFDFDAEQGGPDATPEGAFAAAVATETGAAEQAEIEAGMTASVEKARKSKKKLDDKP